MEEFLELITMNYNTDNNRRKREVMTQTSFSYCIYDTILLQCNTGYVNMLISVRDDNFIYIRKIFSI